MRLLPTGTAWRRLIAWVRNYAGREFCWEAQLILRKEEVPPLRLGGIGGAMLGWSSWLQSKPRTEDADQLIFAGEPV